MLVHSLPAFASPWPDADGSLRLSLAASNPARAVFLSYASQDAEVARKLCEALRAAGVEVWFDQSELRGGDAWDQKIRRQIRDCALFIPVISANTNARTEGYFRLEWKLAVDRSYLMAEDAPFLVPIVIDDTPEPDARVPDRFREVQWTRLRTAETPAEFGARIAGLLSGNGPASRPRPVAPPAGRRKSRRTSLVLGAIAVIAAAASLYVINRRAEPSPSPGPGPRPAEAASVPVPESRQLLTRAIALMTPVDTSVDDFNAAEALIKHALELDPSDGEIWAASAWINAAFYSRGFDLSPERRALSASQGERAVKLAPHSALAWLAHSRSRSDRASVPRDLKQALALAPTPWVRSMCYFGLGSDQNLAPAAAQVLLEKSIDPAVPGSDALAHYGEFLHYFRARRFPEADNRVALAAAELPSVNFVAGRALSQLVWHGDAASAVATLETLAPARRNEPRAVLFRIHLPIIAHRPEVALDVLNHTSLLYLDDNYFTGPIDYWRAWAEYERGQPDVALELRQRAYAVCQRRDAERSPDVRTLTTEAELLAWVGRGDEAQRLVKLLQNEAIDGWRGGTLRVFAALGDAKSAVPLIRQEMAPNRGYWPLTPAMLRLDPLWDKLRSDPGFQELAKGLP